MQEPQPSGWSYRLSPRLVLRTRPPQGPEPAGQVLWIRRGEAFPLGHPTTRLCLDLLREVLGEGGGHRLLDVGCGSGVLALAAAALGVPRVVAVDISRGSVESTRENARENGLASRLIAVLGSTECLKGPFELVAANLPWEVQMAKVPEIDRLAAPAGRLLLSGFRDNQENLLRERYLRRGWSPKRRLIKDFDHPELPPDLSFTWVAWRLEKDG